VTHIPVLLKETIDILGIKNGDKVIDATFGGGGHTAAILDNYDCYVLGVDRDQDAIKRAEKVKEKFGGKFDFKICNFSNLSDILSGKFDAILFDFGVSSFQLDNAERGFSFSKDGRLDMRMTKEKGISAFYVVNTFSEEDIAEIIWKYGEEPKARKIASEIIQSRKTKKIETTLQLKQIISKVFVNRTCLKIDVATKTFQAIRIYVNDELREIDLALKGLPNILNVGARVATISFHSLEDKIVKNWSKSVTYAQPINKSPIKPTRDEILKNPRSRSAILRGFLYIDNRKERLN
jgi:16S rRNA (cytosine1402-N4)-methyltransferase